MSNFIESVMSPVEEEYHPTTEKRSRFRTDMLLRAKGFRIKSRPRDGYAVWTRDGQDYEQTEAVRMALTEGRGDG